MFSVVGGLVVALVVIVFATKRRRRTDPIFGLGAVSPQWLINHREGH